jgi:hypothetical protein
VIVFVVEYLSGSLGFKELRQEAETSVRKIKEIKQEAEIALEETRKHEKNAFKSLQNIQASTPAQLLNTEQKITKEKVKNNMPIQKLTECLLSSKTSRLKF